MTPTQPNKPDAARESKESMAAAREYKPNIWPADQRALACIIDRHFAPLIAQNAALANERDRASEMVDALSSAFDASLDHLVTGNGARAIQVLKLAQAKMDQTGYCTRLRSENAALKTELAGAWAMKETWENAHVQLNKNACEQIAALQAQVEAAKGAVEAMQAAKMELVRAQREAERTWKHASAHNFCTAKQYLESAITRCAAAGLTAREGT